MPVAPGVCLRSITLMRERVSDWTAYPFSLAVIRNLERLDLTARVCFLVGENGTGKSTLLEAIADRCGFGREGGSKHIQHETASEQNRPGRLLGGKLRLSWMPKLTRGYFFRAESFFNIATFLDDLGPEALIPYGGKSLHEQSHGESFLALFSNRFFSDGIYLLDEPEAALSPQRQLSFLCVLHDLLQRGKRRTQFLIATHSPILLAYPGAQILSFDGPRLRSIRYEESQPFNIVSGFLSNPALYLRKLLSEESS